MNKRLENFLALEIHPWLGKSFKKLKKSDLEICFKFLKDFESLDKNDFEFKLNRLFLDKDKPKNWMIISELLSNVNSAL